MAEDFFENKFAPPTKIPPGLGDLITEGVRRDAEQKATVRSSGQQRQLRVLATVGILLGLVAIHVTLVAPLFRGGFTQNLASPEGGIFAQTQFMTEHPSPADWNGRWNFGFGTASVGGPLLFYLLVGLKAFFGSVEISALYRILMGVSFVVSGLTFYLFVRYLTRREFTAIVATLIFASHPLLYTLFLPAETRDVVTQFGAGPWRILNLIVAGDGKHLLSFVFLPLGLLTFLHAMKTGARRYIVVAASAFTLTLLSKWTTWPVVLLLALFLLYSEVVLGRATAKLRVTLWTALLTLGLSAFWIAPFFFGGGGLQGEELVNLGGLVDLVPLSFAIIPIVATVLYLVFDRKPRWQPFFFGSVSSVAFLLLIFAWANFNRSIFTQASLYLPEYQLAMSVLLAVVLTWLVERVRSVVRRRLSIRQANVVTMSLIVTIIGAAVSFVTYPTNDLRQNLLPRASLEDTAEFRLSQWVATAVADDPNALVLAAGSLARWLPALTTVRTVGDVGLPGVSHWQHDLILEKLQSGTDPVEIAAWLRTLGVTHVAVDEKGSGLADAGFRSPSTYAKIETALVDPGPDLTVYRLPGATPVSLVDLERLRSLTIPEDTRVLPDVSSYDASLTPADPSVSFARPDENTLRVDGLPAGAEAVRLAVSHDPGWRDPDGRWRVERDPLGFLLVLPKTGAGASFTLTHGQSTVGLFGYGVTALTLLGVVVTSLPAVRRRLAKRRASAAIPAGVLIPPKPGFVELMVDTPEKLALKHEAAKQYYRETEDFDWVEATDNFAGLDTFFNRNREELVTKMVERFGVGQKILDAGCGSGLVLRKLPPGSIGLDINPRAIGAAKANAPKAALLVADVEQIPFPDNTFTTVVCTEVLDRLPNPERAIKELHRVLAPGGVLIGTVPRENPMWRLRFLSSYNPDAVPWHREFKRPEVEKLFADFEMQQLSPALSYMTWAFVVRKRT